MIVIANTILYCGKWEETVRFYRDHLKLPVNFATDWFVEFTLNAMSRLSIADERRASIKSSHGNGITLSWEIKSLDSSMGRCTETRVSANRNPQTPLGRPCFLSL